jgi:hypothetical protein
MDRGLLFKINDIDKYLYRYISIMNKNILEYLKRNKDEIKRLIRVNDKNKIIDLILSKINKRLFLEIRDSRYKINRSDLIVFSKIFSVIKVDNKIGIIRESYDNSLYNWLKTNPTDNDVNLIMSQINRINSILIKKKLGRLEDIWVKKINKSIPIILGGNRIDHNGIIVGVTNLYRSKSGRENLNKEIRLRNLRSLYNEEELKRIYRMEVDDIFMTLIDNNLDSDLVLRRLGCGNIARLI